MEPVFKSEWTVQRFMELFSWSEAETTDIDVSSKRSTRKPFCFSGGQTYDRYMHLSVVQQRDVVSSEVTIGVQSSVGLGL